MNTGQSQSNSAGGGRWRARPAAHGLYDPANEHDSCGVGFIGHIKGRASHTIMQNAMVMLQHMDHRGACGCEPNSGDGAGILTALPQKLLAKFARQECGHQPAQCRFVRCGDHLFSAGRQTADRVPFDHRVADL